MAFGLTFASASSHIARGASSHSAAQSRKLDRNPRGTAPMLKFGTIVETTTSDNGRGRSPSGTPDPICSPTSEPRGAPRAPAWTAERVLALQLYALSRNPLLPHLDVDLLPQ